jgi:transcriptional regulator with XRE-family HTH domain
MKKGITVDPNWKFYEWRKEAGLTIEDCTRIFEVHKRTVKNWDSGKREPPKAVFLCLQIFAGRLDFLGKNWHGFRIRTECIESPEGDFIYHYEVRAIRYLYQAAGMNRTGICKNLESRKELQHTDNSTKKQKRLKAV